MNSTRIDADGKLSPIELWDNRPTFQEAFCEGVCGLIALCAMTAFVILAFTA